MKVISNQLAYGGDNSNEDNMVVVVGIWVTVLPRELSKIFCLCSKT